MITAKGSNETEYGNVSLYTEYNTSDLTFEGSLDLYRNGNDLTTLATFRGTAESDNDLVDINFDEISIKNGFSGEEIMNISLGLRISDLEDDIEVIDKKYATNINSVSDLLYAFDNIESYVYDALGSGGSLYNSYSFYGSDSDAADYDDYSYSLY